VFATRDGTELDAANVRREFRAACKHAGIAGHGTPENSARSFVRLMSTAGVPVRSPRTRSKGCSHR